MTTEEIALSEERPDLVTFLEWVAESYDAHAKASDVPDEIDGYEGSAAMARQQAIEARSLVTELLALRAAVKPFAKAADIRLCGDFRDDERFGHTDLTFHLTFGDLRRAARALSHPEPMK